VEIQTIARWADSGAREGNPKDLPAAPKFTEGWQLGKPDLIIEMTEPFTVPAGGRDVYRCFVLPTGLKASRTVAAVEFRPGNRRVVHHARFYLDTTGAARKKDKKDGLGPGFRTPGGTVGVPISGNLGGWVPGTTPCFLPAGMGRRIARNTDLLLLVHYKPAGKEEKDQSSIGLFFNKTPPKRIVRGLVLVEPRLRIPAGERSYRRTASYTLPVDVHAISIGPHMHLLGREMKVTAVLPDGKKQPMIWITDWDFNWQGQYQFKTPVALPKGTILHMEAFFDNSSDNPHNPNSPPKLVRHGERTIDEMCECTIPLVVDHPPGDGIILMKDIQRVRRERRRLFEQWRKTGKE
jgi:hypothetical protein